MNTIANCPTPDRNPVPLSPATPQKVTGPLNKILEQRFGRCSGCLWHPDVCYHCENDDAEDLGL